MTNLKIADRLGEVKEYYFSKKLAQIDEMRRAGFDVINLGIGSPDLPPHPSVVEALYRGAKDAHTHGYANYKGERVLLEAIAEWYDRKYGVALDPMREVLTLYGSKEGLTYLCQTFVNPGDRVLVPNPGYPAYAAAVRLAGGIVDDYRLTEANGWMPDFDELENMDLTDVRLMWTNYPNMPTGGNARRDTYERLVAFARRHGIVVVNDNPYSFILNDKPMSLLQIDGAKDCCIEFNSMSKSHNMPGWRVGMCASNPAFIGWILKVKSNIDSGTFRGLQLAAAEAYANDAEWHHRANIETYSRRRQYAESIMQTLGCTFDTEQVGMFLWGKIPGKYTDAEQLTERVLHECRVFITPGFIFGSNGDRYIRISLCAKEEKLQEALKRIKLSAW